LARDAGVHRFLYASTCAVYGLPWQRGAGRRGCAAAPADRVRGVEGAGEDSLWRLVDSDFSPTVLRNATAFGFSPRPRADIVLNNLVGHAVLTGIVKVLSDGTPWRPLVHAGDIAAAVVAVLGAPRDSVHARAFTWAPRRTTGPWPRSPGRLPPRLPGAELVITGETGARPALVPGRLQPVARRRTDFVARWSIPAGAAELAAGVTGANGLTATAFDQRFTPAGPARRPACRGAPSAPTCGPSRWSSPPTGQDVRPCRSSLQLPAARSRRLIAATGSGHSIARSASVVAHRDILHRVVRPTDSVADVAGSASAWNPVQQPGRHVEVVEGLVIQPEGLSGRKRGESALAEPSDVCYESVGRTTRWRMSRCATNDADLAIEWPLPVAAISRRDLAAGSWSELRHGLTS